MVSPESKNVDVHLDINKLFIKLKLFYAQVTLF